VTLRILWLARPVLDSVQASGADLRLFGLSRALVASGHEVHLVVRAAGDQAAARARLGALKRSGTVNGSTLVAYEHPPLRGKLARLGMHPAAGDRLLARAREPVLARLDALRRARDADVCIVSDRAFLYAVPALRPWVATIVDWCDAYTLQAVRAMRLARARGWWRELPGLARRLADLLPEEWHYPRVADLGLAASPADKAWLERLSGVRDRLEVLPNGVAFPAPRARPRTPGRLVFTGNMSFPPNEHAALWFIDAVMPRLRVRHPGVTFVAAGAHPTPRLLSRAGPDVMVPGYVPDLAEEIARAGVYVAPLVSGSGFKNKVVEAIATGALVAATPLAVEFLPGEMRALVPVGDSAEALAAVIADCLSNPGRHEGRRRRLAALVADRYSWERVGGELAAMAERTVELRRARGILAPV
jgi:glycosyltransferase involved in cell wall biosynthesis